jgi:hypothetical protein
MKNLEQILLAEAIEIIHSTEKLLTYFEEMAIRETDNNKEDAAWNTVKLLSRNHMKLFKKISDSVSCMNVFLKEGETDGKKC